MDGTYTSGPPNIRAPKMLHWPFCGAFAGDRIYIYICIYIYIYIYVYIWHVTWGFDNFFNVNVAKLLNKQSKCWNLGHRKKNVSLNHRCREQYLPASRFMRLHRLYIVYGRIFRNHIKTGITLMCDIPSYFPCLFTRYKDQPSWILMYRAEQRAGRLDNCS